MYYRLVFKWMDWLIFKEIDIDANIKFDKLNIDR